MKLENEKCNWDKLNGNKVKIVLDIEDYKLENDSRYYIPFIQGSKWGVMNREGEVIIQPEFHFIYANFKSKSPLFKVGKIHPYAFNRKTTDPAAYYRYKIGLYDSSGSIFWDTKYFGLQLSSNEDYITVQNMKQEYGVLNRQGNIIIPYGRYTYIDGFDNGLSRVKREGKWGIINEQGEEVLPVEYDYIWNFYGKGRSSTRVVKNGICLEIYFYDLNSSIPIKKIRTPQNISYEEDGMYYGEYAGTYAQDVMDYSDEMIDDAFDGDPDAYWNID